MCVKLLARHSCVRYSPEWEHAYNNRHTGFLLRKTLPEFVEYICRLTGQSVPSPCKKVTIPVDVDGKETDMRMVFVDPSRAYQKVCRKFRHFDPSCVLLDRTSLLQCKKRKHCPGFSRINILLVKTGDEESAAPQDDEEQAEVAPATTTDMRSKMTAACAGCADRPKTLKFGKQSSEYDSPSDLKPPPLQPISPSAATEELPELVPITPSGESSKRARRPPTPKLERIVNPEPPSLEPITPSLVAIDSEPAADAPVKAQVRQVAIAGSSDIGCVQRFCGYMDRYASKCNTSFPRGRCLVFMIRDDGLVGRTDMKQNDGNLGEIVDAMSDTTFKKFFERHAATVTTNSGFDAFVEPQATESSIKLGLMEGVSRDVQMLRRNGKFSVLNPRPVPVECFMRHPDDANIWIAVVGAPLVAFKN